MDHLLRPEKHSYFDHLRQRLFKELGAVRAEQATRLLNKIAGEAHRKHHAFRSALLRAYWRRTYHG